ncbi:MAG TPA: YdeI/OmpD-associated family protein [Thermoanaerobaculia bacterium]|jgi:uncharacterized protein YdeI (YjbR/CyaY-like superfamily)
MAGKSPEVDAYIGKAAPFARPILERLRAAFHKADPKIEETMKWSVPHFEHDGIVANMAGFKAHVNCVFRKGPLMSDPRGLLSDGRLKLTDVSELPPEEVLVEYIREAVKLNETGAKLERAPRPAAPPPEAPDDLLAALRREKKALEAFERFPPSHKREYVQWITEAKQEATRAKRIAQAVEWMAEGKSRNWKYERKK